MSLSCLGTGLCHPPPASLDAHFRRVLISHLFDQLDAVYGALDKLQGLADGTSGAPSDETSRLAILAAAVEVGQT